MGPSRGLLAPELGEINQCLVFSPQSVYLCTAALTNEGLAFVGLWKPLASSGMGPLCPCCHIYCPPSMQTSIVPLGPPG